ncbi:interphotoreceptor matrix proteoglycan 1 isoform X2 [Eucyclogobius newberryi]|uniref:interphotoreceptor matrix proteoglycan 1 isoform X2 n=1 Tax=Eucyclogobius newberryi TaxID=166745 RepID=UPI003B5AB316
MILSGIPILLFVFSLQTRSDEVTDRGLAGLRDVRHRHFLKVSRSVFYSSSRSSSRSRTKRAAIFSTGVKMCPQETAKAVISSHRAYYRLRVCQEAIWEAFLVFFDRVPNSEEYMAWVHTCQHENLCMDDLAQNFSSSAEHLDMIDRRVAELGDSEEALAETPAPGKDCPWTENNDIPTESVVIIEEPNVISEKQQHYMVEFSVTVEDPIYNEILRDPATPEYADVVRELRDEMYHVFAKIPGFKEIRVLGFRAEDVSVRYAAIFNGDTELSDEPEGFHVTDVETQRDMNAPKLQNTIIRALKQEHSLPLDLNTLSFDTVYKVEEHVNKMARTAAPPVEKSSTAAIGASEHLEESNISTESETHTVVPFNPEVLTNIVLIEPVQTPAYPAGGAVKKAEERDELFTESLTTEPGAVVLSGDVTSQLIEIQATIHTSLDLTVPHEEVHTSRDTTAAAEQDQASGEDEGTLSAAGTESTRTEGEGMIPESTESTRMEEDGVSSESTRTEGEGMFTESTESTRMEEDGVSSESTRTEGEGMFTESTESTRMEEDGVSSESTRTEGEGMFTESTESTRMEEDGVSSESTRTEGEGVPPESTESTRTEGEGKSPESTESTRTEGEGMFPESTESTRTEGEGMFPESTESTRTEGEGVSPENTEGEGMFPESTESTRTEGEDVSSESTESTLTEGEGVSPQSTEGEGVSPESTESTHTDGEGVSPESTESTRMEEDVVSSESTHTEGEGVSPESTESTHTKGEGVSPESTESTRMEEDVVSSESTESTRTEGESVSPESTKGEGVSPESTEGEGMSPESTEGEGMSPESTEGEGVSPESTEGEDVSPESTEGEGMSPESTEREDVSPESTEGEGMSPESTEGEDVSPEGTEGEGVSPESTHTEEEYGSGLYEWTPPPVSTPLMAAVERSKDLVVFFRLRVSNMMFTENLFNKESPEYKSLENTFLELLLPYLETNLTGFKALEILSFQNGSVIVNSKMKLNKAVPYNVTEAVHCVLEEFCNSASNKMDIHVDSRSLEVEPADEPDPCQSISCLEFSRCMINGWSGEAECVCDPGYSAEQGQPCQSLCTLQPDFCFHGGLCQILPGHGATCRCPVGKYWHYHGERCDELITLPLDTSLILSGLVGSLCLVGAVIGILIFINKKCIQPQKAVTTVHTLAPHAFDHTLCVNPAFQHEDEFITSTLPYSSSSVTSQSQAPEQDQFASIENIQLSIEIPRHLYTTRSEKLVSNMMDVQLCKAHSQTWRPQLQEEHTVF